MKTEQLQVAELLLFIDAKPKIVNADPEVELGLSEKSAGNAVTEINLIQFSEFKPSQFKVKPGGRDDISVEGDVPLNREREKNREAQDHLTKALEYIKSSVLNLSAIKEENLYTDVVNVLNYMMFNTNINGYLRTTGVHGDFGFGPGYPYPIPKKLNKDFGEIGDLITFVALTKKSNATLHGYFKEVKDMKIENKNARNAFLRFIQAARHWKYLREMLKVEHKGSCATCGLTPLAGCYWKESLLKKEKYCFKCYVRGWPGDVGIIPSMTHMSFKGVTADPADALFWNEGN